MICPYCGNVMEPHESTCEVCGRTTKVYDRLKRLSKQYYNTGLEKAQVRDLSGAIQALKRSLEADKHNSDARNLLGLIYYEIGDVVEALTQWVLSKNLDPHDNEADYFLEKTQENPTEYDNMNQAVRKYNVGLHEAKQGHIDLAVIQLRKAISFNPKFLRAIQLLALLYIRNGDYSKAEKQISKGLKIDVSNTTLLRYAQEIMPDSSDNGDNFFKADETEEGKKKGNGILATFSYKEDKPSIMPFVNLVIGVIIGVLVVYYLIVPTVKDDIREEYENQKVDYSAELASKAATITQQEKTIKNLNKKISELENTNDQGSDKTDTSTSGTKKANYNDFFTVLETYNDLKSREYSDSELQELALSLWRLDDSKVSNAYAKGLLLDMRTEIYGLAAKDVYKAGRKLYDDASYSFAAEILMAAVDMDPLSDTAIYYLAKSYQALGENEKAIENYKHMLEVCPNSTLKEYVPERLKECGYTE